MIYKNRLYYKEVLIFVVFLYMIDCINGFGGKISSWWFDLVCYVFSYYCIRKLYIILINKINVIVYFERE